LSYSISIHPAAIKQLHRLSTEAQRRIRPKIDALAENPRPPGCKKLTASDEFYRIRIGDYRVIYSIEDKRLLVLVVKVGHRGDVYE
jgi:mRNA interferase RelE/StbE